MLQHHLKGRRRAGHAWTALKVAAGAAAGILSAAPAASAAAGHIGVGAVTSNAPAGGVPRFGPFEAVFSVSTGAASPYLPYDSSTPPYAANLRPNEDARRGVSVDALLLPPGQTSWGQAQVWPCYWQEDFDEAGHPTGDSGWHLRFAPTQVGTWHYELRATDASGSATTAPASLTCVASTSKGFLHVSHTDSRYFEYGDGAPFIAAGSNSSNQLPAIMSALRAGGGTGLHRAWINALGIIGGANNNGQGITGYSGSLTFEDAHTGRYSMSIPVPSGLGPQITLNHLLPGAAYTLTAWVKGVSEGAGHSPGLWTTVGVCSAVGPPDAHGWQEVRAPFVGGQVGSSPLSLGDWGATQGHLLVDDIVISAPGGGDALGGGGSFEWHTNYNQAAAAQIDQMVQSAQAQGQYLKLACLNKYDEAFGSIANDGTSTHNWSTPEQALGDSPDAGADTPVQRLQRYYARYLVARWGAYTSLHSLEFTNEMDYQHNIEYAGAQAFAEAVHAYTRDGTPQGRILCTSSTAMNGGGLTYDANFYENTAQYPDIDYADFHFYPDSTDAVRGYGLPYDDVGNLYNCRGSVRNRTGGPGGLGRLTFTLASQARGDGNNLQAFWPLPSLRGRGTWTVRYWMRKTDPTAIVHNPQAQVHASFLPGGYAQFPKGGQTPSVSTTWAEYSGMFTVPDDGAHQGCWLNLYGTLDQATPPGTGVEFADVRLIAPDGLPFYRLTFTEPRMAHDSASEATFLAGGKASYSGDPSIGKPFLVGETEPFGNPSGAYALDTSGVFARQAFWASALSPFAQITQFWNEADEAITANDGWRYEGGVERFLAGVPLSSGHFRDIGATASPSLRVVGQSDRVNGEAVLWVQNVGTAPDGSDIANWYNLAGNPSLIKTASGTVDVPGLPPGPYEADVWDTSSGQPVKSLTLTTGGGVLSVPVTGLTGDAAVKIVPLASARMALQLTADRSTVASGGDITFTLNYVNQGTSPALGVNLPWPVPDHTRFVSASSGGTYDATQDTVTWRIGTVPAGASGSVTLTVAAQ